MKQAKSRNMSLQMLRAIRDVENFDPRNYIKVDDPDYYLLIRDPNSAFYLGIKGIGVDGNGKVYYDLEYIPASHSDPEPRTVSIPAEQYSIHFDAWVDYVEEYNDHLVSTDTISEQYREEFFADFELVDEDADIHSFSKERQLLIDAYLTKIVENLEEYKSREDVSEDTKAFVEEAIDTAKDIQETQTRLTKNEVVKKLATFYAKFRKIGVKAMEIGGTELLKGLIKSAIEDPHGLLDKIGGFLS